MKASAPHVRVADDRCFKAEVTGAGSRNTLGWQATITVGRGRQSRLLDSLSSAYPSLLSKCRLIYYKINSTIQRLWVRGNLLRCFQFTNRQERPMPLYDAGTNNEVLQTWTSAEAR